MKTIALAMLLFFAALVLLQSPFWLFDVFVGLAGGAFGLVVGLFGLAVGLAAGIFGGVVGILGALFGLAVTFVVLAAPFLILLAIAVGVVKLIALA